MRKLLSVLVSRSPLRSLRLRLSLAFTCLVALLLVAADAGLIVYARHTASQRAAGALERGLEMAESILTNEFQEAGATSRADRELLSVPLAEALQEMEPALAQEGLSALIVDGSGRQWHSARASGLKLPEARNSANRGWRIRTRQLLTGQPGGTLTVIVGIQWAQIETTLHEQIVLLVALTFFMLLIAAWGAFVIVGRTLRPIAHLAQQAREQTAQASFSASGGFQLVSPSPDAEVVHLVATLNHLLKTLAESTAMKGRFYTAASHELRGPLQVLAGRVELTLSLPRKPEDYRAALIEVQEQADHLVRLVQSLLLLNRLEHSAGEAIPFEPCAITVVCEEQVASLKPNLCARDLSIVFEDRQQNHSLVRAVASSHAEILVRNLLDNAARYTPPGGTIRVLIYLPPSADAVGLEIINTAIPLPPEDVARLQEPFYRPDPSRNYQTGGSGLGLSICRALADVNGWDFSLCQNHDGFHAAVLFPLFQETP